MVEPWFERMTMLRTVSFLLVCLCLFVWSCGHSNRQGTTAPLSSAEIGETVYTFKENNMVRGLYLSDNDQIAALRLQEPFFSIIDVKTRSLQSSYGRKGRASGELLDVPFGVNYRDGELQFFSFATKSMVFFSVPDGRFRSEKVPYHVSFRPTRAVEINGSIIATGGLEQGRVAMVDADQHVSSIADYPFDTGDVSGIYRGGLFQSDIFVAPTLPRFVVRTLASDCFEIYEIDETGVKRVFVNNFKSPPVLEDRRIKPKKCVAGYIRVYVDDEHIYLMTAAGSYQDASNAGLLSDVIHKYDWRGNFEGVIKLPEKVGPFCIRDSVLFGAIEYPDRSEIRMYVCGQDLEKPATQ